MKYPKNITICEVGLRDGLQNEPKTLTVEEKVTIVHMLADAGFNTVEGDLL